jgi:hypothetical protein
MLYAMEPVYINANFLLAIYVIELTSKQRRRLDWISTVALPLFILAVCVLHRYCFVWYFLGAAIIHFNIVVFHNPYLLHASRVWTLQHTPDREVDFNARSLLPAVSLLPAYCSSLFCAHKSWSSGNFDSIYPDVFSLSDEEGKPKTACWMFGPLKTRHPV